MPDRIYLDHAATTPMVPDARAAVIEGMARWANPSSPHAEGRAARAALEDARARIKAALGWRHHLIFTSGATEAIALGIRGSIARAVVTSAIEHDAVLRVTPDAHRFAAGAVPAGPAEEHRLCVVQHGNSETGAVQPLSTGDVARMRERGGLLLRDCAQTAGKLALPEADLIAVSAHKLGGPPGIGALLVRDLGALQATGGQERGYRGGTENLPGALGFAAAAEASRDWFDGMAALRAALEAEIMAAGGEVIAADGARIPTIGAYRMPGVSAAAQMIRFDLAGFAVSAGSACSSGSLRPSHVLSAMGHPPAEAAEVIRVSFGWTTTADQVAAFAAAWAGIARGARGARGMIYLDYQATAPLAPEAKAAMLPWLDQSANPHSPHKAGREAKAAVEVARERVATLLPAGGRVAFTSGATEALNWAIKGLPPGDVVTIATEHAAVLDSVAATGRATTVLPVGCDGIVDLDAAARAIRPGVGVVIAMLVNNEIGVVQPVAALAAMAQAAGAAFVCDAVQGYGRMAITDGCDLIAISAHKIHGPKGIGALWVRDGVAIAPLLHGGGQEPPGRSGTLSPMLCAGFGAAAEVTAERIDADGAHVAALWQMLREALGEEWIVNGSEAQRWRGNLNLRRPGIDAARLIAEVREVAFSAGSACASGSGRPSHVLKAIGLSDVAARASIRLGFGRYTTADEVCRAAGMIRAAADAQRAFA